MPERPVDPERLIEQILPHRDPFLFLDEGLEPHKVRAVFIHSSESPDTFIDISEALDVKLAALKEHRTQMGTWDPTEMITGWARMQGAPRKLEAAESFRLMRFGDT